ncbi:hypothetical protein CR513_47587, partial [Mucuna pruriens]
MKIWRLDQSRLQSMIKKESEGFKEYAQRWRESTKVQPPIMKREMVTMFVDTLPSPYYDREVGNVASNFANLVVVGERIELGIRRRKFTQTSTSASCIKKPALDRKKGEDGCSIFHPNSRGIQIGDNTVSTIHSTKPATSKYRHCHQHGTSIARGEKGIQGSNPNPYDFYQAISPTTGTKANRSGSPKTP